MAAENGKRPLSAAEFKPLDATGKRRSLPVSPGQLLVGLLVAVAVGILIYLFLARAVIFRLDPETAQVDVQGIAFHIGDNFLLMPGEHEVTAEAEGYWPLAITVTVSREATQEIELELEPLPGILEVVSELEDIEVYVDDELAGVAPGTIGDISRGPHKVSFSKHRYFTLHQEIDIEGLGRTQSVSVSLEPAWGQLSFTSIPAGADLFVDDEPIGQTPVTTEVLETGSTIRLSATGYKTWERQVTVKAGTTADYPLIEMTVADGQLSISSAPGGASVTINQEFRGTAPLTVPLSPLRDHDVELYLEGFRKAVRRVSIEPERKSSLSVQLTPIIGRIQLTVEPSDAEVVVDGTSRGTGSRTLELNAKAHTVTVRKAGYESQTHTVVPRPEREQALEVRLLTVQQAYWASRPPLINSPVGAQLKLFRPNAGFTLGAPRREPGRRANEAQRAVRLERPFYIGTHEVSNGEFRRWKEEHSSTALRGNTLDMDRQPVVRVTWQDAALFCNWLSRAEGLPPFYVVEAGRVTGFDPDAHGYRLPTEAEWAWAAMIDEAGNRMIFPWGSDLYPPSETVENYADQSAAKFLSFTLSNYNDGFPVSAPVGNFQPNGKGLYDMSGNVAEWTNDYYDIRPSRGEPELDPTGPETGSRHVIRGASWSMGSRSELRLSYRDAGDDGRLDLGFRIARYVDKAGVRQ